MLHGLFTCMRSSSLDEIECTRVCMFYSQVLGDGVKSCIIDTEAVAWDREKKQILPFQILSTRKRKVICGLHSDNSFDNGEREILVLKDPGAVSRGRAK